MNDKELIGKIKELRSVKPSQDWVSFTKNRILTEEKFGYQEQDASVFSVFRYKLALAPLLGVFVVIGLFGFAQSTIPGDFFFSVKKMTETVQVGLTSIAEKPKVQLQLANRRLEELSRIAESNRTGNLAPAIEEFQASVAEAARDLAAMGNVTSSDQIVLKELIEESRKLSEGKERVESVLGTKIGDTEELETALGSLEKKTAEYLIEDLENRTLSEGYQEKLEEAKENFDAGDYQEALFKLWQIHNH